MAERRERPSTGLFFRLLFCGCCYEDRVRIASIDLSHSLLTELPPEVYLCERTLESLCLDSNHLVELPRQLFNCDELRILSVSDNDIHFLPPAISFLQNLEHLDLSKNAIATLPDTIRQCASLSYLDVSINPLEKLPEGLVNVISLQELYLTDTYLDFLPANFGKLVNLRILELRENSLSTLPKTMCRLINLTRLDIGFNEFTELPEVVCSLQNLTELWIDGNHIKKLNPSIGHLRKMVHFDASHNNLEHLPRDIGYWTKVQEFNVANNELVSLPNTIGNLRNLVGLKLEENSLQSLPDSIGKLPCLQEIMATHNYLSHLPASIGLLRSLKILTVDKNDLLDIPSELGSCTSLSILSLRGNKISEIPAEIGHLSSLKVLNVVDNEIRFLPMSILKLDKLGALWLSNNQSQPLIPLQQDFDFETNTNILTCFMLPQHREPQPGPSTAPDDEVRPAPRVAPRHIYFAPNTGIPLEQPGRLTRAPTPYPKELRALAKHAKHVQKTLSFSHHRPEEAVAQQIQGPPEIKEATVKVKTGTIASPTSAVSTSRSVDSISEPKGSPASVDLDHGDTIPTPDSSVSSLPVAYESSPIIREAKNIRTDTQTGPIMQSPTPQIIIVAPAPKEAKVPPPYHIAAAYSVKAQFFNPSEYSAPENISQSPCTSADDNNDQQNIHTQGSPSPVVFSTSYSEAATTSPYLNEPRQTRVSSILMQQESANGQEDMCNTGKSQTLPITSDISQRSGPCGTQYSSSEGRGTASPTPDAGERVDRADQPTMRSLSDYVVKSPVFEIDKYAISRPDDLEGEHISTRSLTGYALKSPDRGTFTAFDVNKYAIEDYKGQSHLELERPRRGYFRRPSFSDSTSEKDTLSSDALSPGEVQLPQDFNVDPNGNLSPGEVRLSSNDSLEVCLPTSVPSSISLPQSTHTQRVYSSERRSSEDVSDPQSSYSARRPHIHLDEFVSKSGNITGTSSSQTVSGDGTSIAQVETSSRSESSSRKSFTLLTPPLPQTQSLEYSVATSVAERSSGSDIIAGSVECDMNSSDNSNPLTDRSPTEYAPISPEEEVIPCATHTLSPIHEQPEYLSPKASPSYYPLPSSKTSSVLQPTYSTQTTEVMSVSPVSAVQPSYLPPSVQNPIMSTHSSSHSSSTNQSSRSTRPVHFHNKPLLHALQPHQQPGYLPYPQPLPPLHSHKSSSSFELVNSLGAQYYNVPPGGPYNEASPVHSVQSQQTSSDYSMKSPHISSRHSIQSPSVTSSHSMQSPVVSSGHQDSLVHSVQSIVSSTHSAQSNISSTQSVQSNMSSTHSVQSNVSSTNSVQSNVPSTYSVPPNVPLMHSIQSNVSSRHSDSLAHSVRSHHMSPAHSVQFSRSHASLGQAVQSPHSLSGRSQQSHLSPGHSVHSQKYQGLPMFQYSQGLPALQSPGRVSPDQSHQELPAHQSSHGSLSYQPSHQELSHASSPQVSIHSSHHISTPHSQPQSSSLSSQAVSHHTSLYAPEYINRPQSAFSGQSVQSTQASSVHSLPYAPPTPERSRSDVSLRLDQSVQSPTHTSAYFPQYTGKPQSVHTTQASSVHTSVYFPVTPEPSQPVSHTPSMHSNLHSDILDHSSLLGFSPRSVPSSQSIQTPYTAHSYHSMPSHETVDSSAHDVSDVNRPHNINEEFTRTTHPGAILDNNRDNDLDNNFNPDDNKPRFFVQDKPAPGQNIFAPTPKRPNTGDRSTRIPFLSPTLRRGPGFVTPSTTTSQVIASPRSCRRDTPIRVQSDISIISGGSATQKTKIPAPHAQSKPVSPDRTKKWVFGKHKNATVMNVLITKNPDLGFSITEVHGKGIFIDDVKGQDCLSVGDKILEVEGIDVTVLNKEEVMEILLSSGKNISMMISHI